MPRGPNPVCFGFQGREPRGTDRYDMSYDSGEYLPNAEVMDDPLTAARSPESCRTPPSVRSAASGEPPYPVTDNLVNGGHETDAREPEVIAAHTDSTAQSPAGVARSPRVHERKLTAPNSPSEQEPSVNGSLGKSPSTEVNKSRESLIRDSVKTCLKNR